METDQESTDARMSDDDQMNSSFKKKKKTCILSSDDEADDDSAVAPPTIENADDHEMETNTDDLGDENKENIKPPQDQDEVDGAGPETLSRSRLRIVDSSDNEEAEAEVPADGDSANSTGNDAAVAAASSNMFANSDLFAQDDSSDNDRPVLKEIKIKKLKKKKKKARQDNESGSGSGSSSSEEEGSGNDDEKRKAHRLSGSEKSGSEKSARSDDSDKSDKSDKSASEESADEGPKIGRWSKSKGAAKVAAGKKERKKRSPKKNRNAELEEIHSESQRLVRESEVRLPYHKPKPLDLKAILERQKARKPAMQLRPTPSLIRQMSIEEAEKKRKEAEEKKKKAIDKKFGITDFKPGEAPVVAPEDKCRDWVDNKTGSDVTLVNEDEKSEPEVRLSAAKSAADLPSYLLADSDNESLPELTVVMENSADNKTPENSADNKTPENSAENKTPDPDSGIADDEGSGKPQEGKDMVDFSIPTGMNADALKDDLPDIGGKESGDSEQKEEFVEEKKQEIETLPNKRKAKLALLAGEVVSFTPKLGSDQGFIDFRDSDDETKIGMELLKTRFMKQTKKLSPKQKMKVELTCVTKEKSASTDKEELKLSTVSYVSEPDPEAEVLKPGARLTQLQDRLRSEMRKQRAEARQKKLELMKMDNEEGFDEEEAELTDSESEEDEENDVEEEDTDVKMTSEFADDEADDDEEQTNEDKEEDKDENDATDDESEVIKPEEESLSRESDPNGLTSSLNLSTQDMFTPFSKSSLGTISQKTSKTSALTLPIEDTQDLLKIDDDILPDITSPKFVDSSLEDTQSLLLDEHGFLKSGGIPNRPKSVKSVPQLNLLLDGSSQDNMDDLLGLCSGGFTTQPEKTAMKNLFDSTQADDNMSQLFGLCSGKFASQSQAAGKTQTIKTQSTQQSANIPMDEDANDGLSGTSIKSAVEKAEKSQKSDDDDDDLELRFISDDEDETSNSRQNPVSKKSSAVFSDEENSDEGNDDDNEENGNDESDENENENSEEEENESEGEMESDDERQLIGNPIYGKAKKEKRRAEFFEEEAELSGSEAGSDENEDLDDTADVLEQELGDLDDVGTTDQLRDQVGKVHLKSMMDQDKRELKLFQEMYLADGDLHSDGGRNRKFRWKNIDDALDVSGNHGDDSDGENMEDDEDMDMEIKRRKERFERERWLAEQRASQTDEEQNSLSQISKRRATKRHVDFLSQPKPTEAGDANSLQTSPKSILKPPSKPQSSLAKVVNPFMSQSTKLCGSFLKKSKEQLARIAEAMGKSGPNHTGTTNARNFVFSAVSPADKKRKQHQPSSASQPKRIKLDVNKNETKSKPKQKAKSSIFDFL